MIHSQYLSPLLMAHSRRFISSLGLLSLFVLPASAFAHEHQTFRIGDKTYDFVIGSLNEPVNVDDKSGLDLAVSVANEHAEDETHVEGDSHAASTPVQGLEKTLKVELQAAGKTKELPITTQYGKPGSYKAIFIPTVATTLTYRIFGTIDGNSVDLSFTCNPAGHPASPEDTTELKISDAVTRISKSGAFGCPVAKAELGFPEPSAAIVDLANDDDSSATGSIALALSAVALAFGVIGFARSARPQA